MRKFTNDAGCEMSFDEELSEEVIRERLNWLGNNWREIKIQDG